MSGTSLQNITGYRQGDNGLQLHPEHLDDRALWDSFRSGDEKALVHIFDRYANALHNYGRKIAADDDMVKDAVQELFIVIWRRRQRLGETDCIKSYLFKSLRRKLVRSLSRIRHRLFGSLSVTAEYTNEVMPSPEVMIIAQQVSEEKRERLMQMIKTLTHRQQEAMFLRYFEEMSCEEIAVVMALSKQAVYNLISHALKALRDGSRVPDPVQRSPSAGI